MVAYSFKERFAALVAQGRKCQTIRPRGRRRHARAMGTTLLLAWSGETFVMNAMPIWVRPMLAGMMVANSFSRCVTR